MLEPDILLDLGKQITSIVRDSLILDRRMEEICTALDREGRMLSEVIDRNNSIIYTGEIDDAAIACEKACSLLKAAIQVYFLQHNSNTVTATQLLHQIIESHGRVTNKSAGAISSERIKDILDGLETNDAQAALATLHLVSFYEDLKIAFERLEATLFEKRFTTQPEKLPTLRSSVALYGMLIDTLIANVRFENYQLLHRVQSVLSQIETVISKAVSDSVHRQKEQPQFAIESQQAFA